MHMTATLKRALAMGGVSLLAVVGLIGWTRRSEEPTGPGQANYLAPRIGNPEPVSRDPNAQVVYGPSPFGPEIPAVPANQAYGTPPRTYGASPSQPTYALSRRVAPARVVPQRRYRRTSRARRRYVVVRKRPFSHSAAIVGGSAAGGALIGALAGGGKGAAIGALAGGGGGLVYDRATHKKRLVSER